MGKKRKIKAGMPDIGELRASLEHRRDSQGWALVRDWAEQAWEADREQFNDIWVHYLLDHVARWPARVCEAPRRWLLRAAERDFGPLRLARRIVLDERRLTPEDWRLLPALAGKPEVAHIAILSADKLTLSKDEVAALTREGAWPGLRELAVGGVQSGDMEALWGSALMAQLDALWLRGLGEVRAACGHAALPRLKRLTLLAAGQERGAVLELHALLQQTALPGLEALDLSHSSMTRSERDWERWPLVGAPLREVVLWGTYALQLPDVLNFFGPTLEALDLGSASPGMYVQRIQDEAFIAMLRRPVLRSPIKRLSLRGAQLGERSLRAWCEGGQLATLEELNLSACARIGNGAMEHLSHMTHLKALRALDLSHTGFNNHGARWLMRWPLLGQLERLDLRQTDLGELALAQLREAAGERVQIVV